MAESFAGLLNTKKLKAGDELHLEHRFQIWGGLELPDDFTISAIKGAGFDVTDGGKPKSGRPLFKLGQRNSLLNLTLNYLHAPPLGPTGEKMHVNYTHRLGILAQGKHDILIENCVFQDNLRGGIFRRLREGLDIKAFYNRKSQLSPEVSCSNIRIENCQFYDMPNGITLTTIDGGRRRGPGRELITPANIKDCAPHDIDVINCIFGHLETPLRPRGKGGYGVEYPKKGEHMRMFLIKDAYDIRYQGIRFLGDRIRP